MDAKGTVVAASELIRFETGCGLLLTIFNTYLDFHFYIFAHGNLVQCWKNIHVNHQYEFSNLKVGAVELLSGTKKIVLLTTGSSSFCEIQKKDPQKFNIPSKLMKIVSVPGIFLSSDLNPFAKLISYQGFVTGVKSSKLGIYELDKKVHLYLVYNSFHSVLTPLRKGSEVFVSNTHFFRDFKGRRILVCCGLSSVRPLLWEENLDTVIEDDVTAHFYNYPISIYDVIWMETLLVRLKANFFPSVIANENVFSIESNIIKNILESFTNRQFEKSRFSIQSACEEYCSYPHTCCAFCDDNLPTDCEVPSVSQIIDKASSSLVWVKNSSNWNTSYVKNQTKYILCGMLYLSKNGCWYIKDASCDIPIILSKRCDKCSSDKNMLCAFDNLNLGYLVALQNFDIVFEKIKYKTENYSYYQYIRTSCCYIFYLGTFFKSRKDVFQLVSFSQDSLHIKPIKYSDSIEEVTSTLASTHLDEQDVWTSADTDSSAVPNKDLMSSSTYQYVLILNRIWTIINQSFVCYQILALLLPQEEIYDDYFDKSQSLFEDSNFYETDDDLDFAELVDSIDNLFLEDKPRLVRLHFESTKQCASLLPGHIYVIDFSGNFIKENILSGSADKSNIKPFLVKIKADIKIIHHLKCLGHHSPDDYDVNIYCDINQVILERKIKENSILRAILIDKLYEEPVSSSNSQKEESNQRWTFCLLVKDYTSTESIKVYLPASPKNMFGFLPDSSLIMSGFVCVCSKRGYLYLTPSSSFGIQILYSQELNHTNTSLKMESFESCSKDDLNLAHLQSAPFNASFKCLCFIVKILSVKLWLVCNSCMKEFQDKCSCLCTYVVKLTVNFLIDDGSDQKIATSYDETAKKILMFSEDEWKRLACHVSQTKEPLKFVNKTVEEDPAASDLMSQVFSVYCSSKMLCRKAVLICKRKLDGSQLGQKSVWCYDILKLSAIDLIPDLLVDISIDNQNV